MINNDNKQKPFLCLSLGFVIGSDITISKYTFPVNQTWIWLIILDATEFYSTRDQPRDIQQDIKKLYSWKNQHTIQFIKQWFWFKKGITFKSYEWMKYKFFYSNDIFLDISST